MNSGYVLAVAVPSEKRIRAKFGLPLQGPVTNSLG